jgi:hypothetical protein
LAVGRGEPLVRKERQRRHAQRIALGLSRPILKNDDDMRFSSSAATRASSTDVALRTFSIAMLPHVRDPR